MRRRIIISLAISLPSASASFLRVGSSRTSNTLPKAFQSRVLVPQIVSKAPIKCACRSDLEPSFSSWSLAKPFTRHKVSSRFSQWCRRKVGGGRALLRLVIAAMVTVFSFLSARILPVAASAASHGASVPSPPAIIANNKEMLWMNVEAVFRIIFAAVLGSTLGLETSKATKKQTGAGQRTMALVSLGACVFTICGTQGFAMAVAREAAKEMPLRGIENASVDASRMASTITAGVGFLGAGVISNNRSPDGTFDPESAKRGLTTAATIWVASAVGSSIGAGMYYVGLFFVLTTLFVLGTGQWLDLTTDEKVSPKKQSISETAVEVEVKPGANDTTSTGSLSNTTVTQESMALSSPLLQSEDSKRTKSAKKTWLESLDGEKAKRRQKSKEAGDASQKVTAAAAIATSEEKSIQGDVVNATSTSSAAEAIAAEVKEPPPSKNIDLYVDKFLKKGGTIKADTNKKDLADDEENESQQIIW